MSGNFVRERQRIVYIYNIHVNNTLPLAHEISRHFWAAYAKFKELQILTSEVSQDLVLKFGQRYFGTE